MQYAIVDSYRLSAAPRLRGSCPHCGSPVLAKCGSRRVWHWSHLGKKHCDRWWEPETEWHRGWKAHFPDDWHEVGHYAPDGERHVADLKSPHGLVVEFQHSAISDKERAARTDFYGNMVWVVDGLRRKRDRPRFAKSIFDWGNQGRNPWTLFNPEWALPNEWLECSVPVFFDFGPGDVRAPGDPEPRPAHLWCLLPKLPSNAASGQRHIVEISVEDFITNSYNGHPLPEWSNVLRQIEDEQKEAELAHIKQVAEYEQRQRQYRWARRNGLI